MQTSANTIEDEKGKPSRQQARRSSFSSLNNDFFVVVTMLPFETTAFHLSIRHDNVEVNCGAHYNIGQLSILTQSLLQTRTYSYT